MLLTRARPPIEIHRETVLEKANAFADFQVWPFNQGPKPDAWLSNFRAEDERLALHLLNAFLFFSETITDQLLIAAFQDLSNRLRQAGQSPDEFAE